MPGSSVRETLQEYWSGLHTYPPGDLPDPGIELASPVSPALASGFLTTGATWEAGALLCLSSVVLTQLPLIHSSPKAHLVTWAVGRRDPLCVVCPGVSPLALQLTPCIPAAGEAVQSPSLGRSGLWSGPAGAALCYSDQIPSSSGEDALQMAPHMHRCCCEGVHQPVRASAQVSSPD